MHLKYKWNKSGIGRVERRVLDALASQGINIVNIEDLENNLGYSPQAASLCLSRLKHKGWLQRLTSGVYHLIPLGSGDVEPIPDDTWAVGMKIFSPCYISGWTAAEYWELTEQIFNSIVILTTKKLRNRTQSIAGIEYITKHINERNLFGTKKIWSGNTQILIADQHRTIIDILDDPDLGGGGRHTLDIIKSYKNSNNVDPTILLEYAEKLNRGALFKRLGFVGEKILNFPDLLLEKLRAKIKTGIIKYDPSGPNSGPIITKWGIRINIPMGDLKC